MKKLLLISLAVIIALSVGITVAAAEDNIPSAKCAFVYGNVGDITADDQNPDTILTTQIKTGATKDLVLDLSAETSLITDVQLQGDAGSTATAGIMVAVFVDGAIAAPGWVTYNNRILEVAGDLTHHYNGLNLEIDDHIIQIFLETKMANAFNFVKEDVGSGVHDVVVKAYKVESPSSTGKTRKDDVPYAYALLGNVSMIVDEANLK